MSISIYNNNVPIPYNIAQIENQFSMHFPTEKHEKININSMCKFVSFNNIIIIIGMYKYLKKK